LPHKPSGEVRERIFRCTHGNLQGFNDFMLRLKTTFDAGIKINMDLSRGNESFADTV